MFPEILIDFLSTNNSIIYVACAFEVWFMLQKVNISTPILKFGKYRSEVNNYIPTELVFICLGSFALDATNFNNFRCISYFQTGRKLVFRSEPPRHKKKEDDRNDQQSKEEEELAYFFTWQFCYQHFTSPPFCFYILTEKIMLQLGVNFFYIQTFYTWNLYKTTLLLTSYMLEIQRFCMEMVIYEKF